jgi:dihydrolipoamide dehydrogenase
MADNPYDLVVIGSGTGGYQAAIRASQLGFRTALVEKDPNLGGTCLNVGCIPSKAMLESTSLVEELHKTFQRHGIQVGDLKIDLPTMLKRKEGVVKQLNGGVALLMKKHKVDVVTGIGRITGPGTVAVGLTGGEQKTLATKRILIATGSVPSVIPGVVLDPDRVGTSTEALSYPEVPKDFIIIGAGVIGLELGSVWGRLGSKVTVVEYLDRILPGMDDELAVAALKTFQRQGFTFILGARVTGARAEGNKGVVTFQDKSGETKRLEGDRVLVAVGRRPFTDGLGAKEAGVDIDQRGRIVIDEHWQTSVPGIYAVGDCVRGAMLAHKASEEGIAAVEYMATGVGHMNYDAVPNIIYTAPEIASVGKTEEELKAAGIAYRKGEFPFAPIGRAKALAHTEGFVKILADAKTDRILGAHIIGWHAGDLIAELSLAIEFGASSEDVARAVHAHPTLAEAVKEAALAVDNRSIHAG